MKEVNQSNVAINFNNSQAVVFEMQSNSVIQVDAQINPQVTPIITQNVPFKNEDKGISKWYIGINIFVNLCYLILVVVMVLTDSQLGRSFIIAITASAYLVYLVVAYHFSNLLPIVSLQNIHEYKNIYEQLTTAKCSLKFKYTSARNNIDQMAKCQEMEYSHIDVVDRSGVFYSVERTYEVIFVKYNKKFYYCDNTFKNKVYEEFGSFVEKCKKEHEPGQKKYLLRGKEKIELMIQDMKTEMGFYVNEGNCYRLVFFLTLLAGGGVYYELFMRNRVIRYELDIVKEIRPGENPE